jgi:hypothetical protein
VEHHAHEDRGGGSVIALLEQNKLKAFGSCVVSWARFVPAASPALQVPGDQFGVKTITRDAAGRWTVVLAEKSAGFVAFVGFVENDTTNVHLGRIESYDYAAGTFTFVHRTAAFASLASLALSDTVDEIWLAVIARQGL